MSEDQARWTALMEQKAAAEACLEEANDIANQVIEALKEGVDISVAARIITDYWGELTPAADKLRQQLSSSFPEKNGQVILSAPLCQSDLDRLNGSLDSARSYFQGIHGFISELVGRIMHQIKSCDVNDQSAVALYNKFRENVLLYLDYSGDYFYEARKVLESEETAHWGNLRVVTTRQENGDYLFIDDFEEDLKKTHDAYITYTFNQKESEWWSLYDLRWSSDRIVPRVKLPYLFALYLLETLTPLEAS
jgi:hypothetical protein